MVKKTLILLTLCLLPSVAHAQSAYECLCMDASLSAEWTAVSGSYVTVDCLSSTLSTLCLTDDATDQTLTGDLGDIYIKPADDDLFVQSSGGTTAFEVNATDTSALYIRSYGTIKTEDNVGWDLGSYSSTAPTATGFLTVEVAGITYKIPARDVGRVLQDGTTPRLLQDGTTPRDLQG